MPKCTQNICPYLGPSHFEGLCATVDDWDIGTTRTDEAHALGVGRQLHSSLCGHSVTGVEDGAVRDSAEHGQVLQRHLGGAILTCTEQSTEPCNETRSAPACACKSPDETSVKTQQSAEPCNEACSAPANHQMKPTSKPSSQQNLQ